MIKINIKCPEILIDLNVKTFDSSQNCCRNSQIVHIEIRIQTYSSLNIFFICCPISKGVAAYFTSNSEYTIKLFSIFFELNNP